MRNIVSPIFLTNSRIYERSCANDFFFFAERIKKFAFIIRGGQFMEIVKGTRRKILLRIHISKGIFSAARLITIFFYARFPPPPFFCLCVVIYILQKEQAAQWSAVCFNYHSFFLML